MEAPTESPLPRTVARERRWICEHRWQGVAGGGLCWNSLLASLHLTGNWHRTNKKTPTQRLLNLFWDCYLGCNWIDSSSKTITRNLAQLVFVGGCYWFPFGEVKPNWLAVWSGPQSNWFGCSCSKFFWYGSPGELKRSSPSCLTCFGDWTLQRSCHWR